MKKSHNFEIAHLKKKKKEEERWNGSEDV